jgi:PTH2 family peptidyl-tRNA hydrolase
MSSTKYKQVIVLRRDLNMRKGKMAAQAAHASMGALLRTSTRQPDADPSTGTVTLHLDAGAWGWINDRFAKVVVGARDLDELLALQKAAQDAGLRECLIQDAGFTEFNGVPTYTALCIGPDEVAKIDAITGHLTLL